MSTVGERVRAIQIGPPTAQAAINKPLCAHDRAVQGISPASITRLTQRGYVTVDSNGDAPRLLSTEAGCKALGRRRQPQ